MEDLTLFQALDYEQVFLKHFLKRKFGVHFPPVSLRTCLCCLTLAGFQQDFARFVIKDFPLLVTLRIKDEIGVLSTNSNGIISAVIKLE